jgi:hypothetical protein
MASLRRSNSTSTPSGFENSADIAPAGSASAAASDGTVDRRQGYRSLVAKLRFDQVNIVMPDVAGASGFLRALGVQVPEPSAEWMDWAEHHVEVPTATEGFGADLDSPAYAAHWGGLTGDFTGVVVNLRAEDRNDVDATFDRALELGAEGLRQPYDAFWGARYAVVRGPGPIVIGVMSPPDPAHRGEPPAVSDLA